MLFTVILSYTIVLAAIVYYFDSIRLFIFNFRRFNRIPGPPAPNIIIGNIMRTHAAKPEHLINVRNEFTQNYSPTYNLRALHINVVNLLGQDEFETVLSNPKHNNKSFVYTLLHEWLGTGLLTSGGKKWITRRRILTPAFHFSILQQFVSVFNEETEKLVETLREKSNEDINIVPYIAQFTLKTITETAMGTKLSFTTKKGTEYKQAVDQIGMLLFYRFVRLWFVFPIIKLFCLSYYKERKLIKTLHKFTKDVIAEREKNFEDVVLPTEEHDVYTGKKRLAMLDLLLTAKNKEGTIDDNGIREEVDTFMFEGHDTTAAALGFALMLIANHKPVQDNIFDEIHSVLGDVRKKPTYQDLQDMKYLDRTIKEVLRLYPSVHFISRQLGEDLITKDGCHVPKNATIMLHIYDLHRNPDIYPEPEKFDPDRFLPENCKDRHPFAYVPFSAGSRNCIGQRFAMLEMKAAICGILANFNLEPVDTPETIKLITDIVLRTKNGIKVKFVPKTC